MMMEAECLEAKFGGCLVLGGVGGEFEYENNVCGGQVRSQEASFAR